MYTTVPFHAGRDVSPILLRLYKRYWSIGHGTS
jgi:predicted RNA binding protein YcfA (HicA-like mRNA interferase family)